MSIGLFIVQVISLSKKYINRNRGMSWINERLLNTQGKGGILIGACPQIAPNLLIVSSNQDIYDSLRHTEEKVIMGNYCWLGAGENYERVHTRRFYYFGSM